MNHMVPVLPSIELHDNIVGVGSGLSGPANRPDFDSPIVYNNCNHLGDSKPLPLEYTSMGRDSGGGLFSLNDGRTELIGVTAEGNNDIAQFMTLGYYGTIMGWVKLSVFKDWLKQTRK